jgi:sugar phosphate isomerase/epimerase
MRREWQKLNGEECSESRGDMTRTISLAALTVIELAPPDMVSCAAEAGYSHVGLRLIPVMPQDIPHPIIGDTPMRREVLARLAATGVKVLDIEFIRIRPESRAADFLPMMESGARLGARHVLAGGNDPDEARLAERFAELCDAAAGFGLSVNLEPIPIPVVDLHTLAQASRVLSAAGRANGGVVIDPIHFDRAGERLDDVAGIPRKWLNYMQLCDAPAERPADTEGLQFQARYERMIPGEGGLDLPGLLRALPRDLPISVEVPLTALARSVGAVERARRILKATHALLQRL